MKMKLFFLEGSNKNLRIQNPHFNGFISDILNDNLKLYFEKPIMKFHLFIIVDIRLFYGSDAVSISITVRNRILNTSYIKLMLSS